MRSVGFAKILGFYAALTAVAGIALWRMGRLPEAVWPESGWAGIALAVGAGLAAGIAGVVASRLIARRFAWGAHLEAELRALVGPLGAREALALLSAAGEEALFRGVLQQVLGLWIAAALFGILHLGPSARLLPWGAMAFVAGLIFGALFLGLHSLVAPFVAHATVNYLNLRYLGASAPETELHLGPVGGEHVAGR
ncbi:MAG: CPBP family intramembrane metalloprotease [Deltaproteobacteria bacterium]|nr:CPBP family intramembrane metalloprotease [Deltaproteobacteria bacterium]